MDPASILVPHTHAAHGSTKHLNLQASNPARKTCPYARYIYISCQPAHVASLCFTASNPMLCMSTPPLSSPALFLFKKIFQSFASASSPRASIDFYSWTRSSSIGRSRTDLFFYRQMGKILASDWLPT